jgi:HK97 family phage portal protein
MTTLQTADGRLLRASRPRGSDFNMGSGGFRPMWSDGSSDHDDPNAYLKSYAALYRSQPILSGVIDKLTRRVATLPLIAYKGKPGGPREATTGDSLDTLLRKPMPRHGTVHLVSHIEQSLLIHGNALIAKLRGSDPDAPPTMLWPLDWAQTSAFGEQGGRIEWWSTTQFGPERFIRTEDVVHFAWPGPDGGEIGVSPLEKLQVTIRLEDAAQRHQTASFRNGARPGGIFTLPPGTNPTKEQMELTRATIQSLYSGDNAFKTGIVAPGAKWEAMSMTPVEVELIQQRKLNREEVGIVFDMAGPLMGDLEHATFTNVTEMLRSLYRDVIPPWTELIVQTMQAQLIDPEPMWLDRFARFDFSDKLKGDPTEQAAVDKSDVEAGIRTRDEARDGRGLKPKKGNADKLTLNANNQAPIDSLDAEPPPPAVDPSLDPAATAAIQ